MAQLSTEGDRNVSHILASGCVVDAGRAECAAGGVGSCSHLLLPHHCTSIRDLGCLGMGSMGV